MALVAVGVINRYRVQGRTWMPGGRLPAVAAVPDFGDLVFRQLNENRPRLVSLDAPVGDTNTRQLLAGRTVALILQSRSVCDTHAGAPEAGRRMRHRELLTTKDHGC
ncbi:hypothetical protein J2809_003068 [Arthrobacter pascens]|nr:hypothetical protein [Arthrobacter pascens]